MASIQDSRSPSFHGVDTEMSHVGHDHQALQPVASVRQRASEGRDAGRRHKLERATTPQTLESVPSRCTSADIQSDDWPDPLTLVALSGALAALTSTITKAPPSREDDEPHPVIDNIFQAFGSLYSVFSGPWAFINIPELLAYVGPHVGDERREWLAIIAAQANNAQLILMLINLRIGYTEVSPIKIVEAIDEDFPGAFLPPNRCDGSVREPPETLQQAIAVRTQALVMSVSAEIPRETPLDTFRRLFILEPFQNQFCDRDIQSIQPRKLRPIHDGRHLTSQTEYLQQARSLYRSCRKHRSSAGPDLEGQFPWKSFLHGLTTWVYSAVWMIDGMLDTGTMDHAGYSSSSSSHTISRGSTPCPHADSPSRRPLGPSGPALRQASPSPTFSTTMEPWAYPGQYVADCASQEAPAVKRSEYVSPRE